MLSHGTYAGNSVRTVFETSECGDNTIRVEGATSSEAWADPGANLDAISRAE
jgi:hypothetical protein